MNSLEKSHKGNELKFSFVMPIYNVEKYIGEAVQSIINQTLDFEKNCEIIFVDDGSTDASGEICLRCKEKYPHNVTYIKQKNQGVAAARNAGVKAAKGTYISFLDPDDKLSLDTLESIYVFFEKHKMEIDVVSIRIDLFEAQDGPHHLNYKFTDSRVIHVDGEWDKPQLSGGSAFVKRSVFEKRIFDTRLHNTSDAKFLAQTVLDKMAYGVVKGPIYHYRKRHEDDSIINVSRRRKDWYLKTPIYAHKEIIDESIKRFGGVPKYIQFLLMYDLQWRFKQSEQDVLSDLEIKKYKKLLVEILQYIDDDVIFKQRNISIGHKLFILGKKHGNDPYRYLTTRDSNIFYKDVKIYDYNKKRPVFTIYNIIVVDGECRINGRFNTLITPDTVINFRSNNQIIKYDKKHEKSYFLGETLSAKDWYDFSFNVSNEESVLNIEMLTGDTKRNIDVALFDGSLGKVGEIFIKDNLTFCRYSLKEIAFRKLNYLYYTKKRIINLLKKILYIQNV